MMKKFKSFMVMAAAILIGFSSCQNDTPGTTPEVGQGTPEGASIGVTISIPGTRAIGEAQWEYPVYLNRGYILLATGGNNPQIRAVAEAVLPTGAGSATTMFDGVSAGIEQAVFVGNTVLYGAGTIGMPGIVLLQDLVGTDLEDVLNFALEVETQRQMLYDPTNHATINPGNTVNVFRASALQNAGASPTDPATTLWTTTLLLEPTVARVEIFNVTGSADIQGFRMLGVYVDAYYRTGRVGSGRTNWVMRGDGSEASIANFTGAFFNDTNMFNPLGVDLEGVIWDEPATIGDWPVALVTDPTSPQYGQWRATAPQPAGTTFDDVVWGYNLFAGNITPGAVLGTRTPRIAIKIDQVEITERFRFRLNYTTFDVVLGTPRPALPGEPNFNPDPLLNGTTTPVTHENIVDHYVIGIHPITMPHYRTRTLVTNADPAFDNDDRNQAVIEFLADYFSVAEALVTPAFIVNAINDHATPHVFALAIAEAVAEAEATHEAGRYEMAANSNLFISIRGFQGVPRENGFMPRHVYQMGSYTSDRFDGDPEAEGSWEFGPGDLHDIPFLRDIDVNVTVVVQNWVPTPVVPELH